MPKTTVTPLELAQKYLIKIGVDKFFVQRSLLPSLFEDAILCKQMNKSNVVLQNKRASTSNETHIFINQSFSEAFFTPAQKAIYDAGPVLANNQLSNQDLELFEANISDILNRRSTKLSTSVVAKSPINTYTPGTNTILAGNVTKWFNQHNGETQLHIGKDSTDSNEFKDLRLGILIDDYLLMFKYAHKDVILTLAIPKEFYSKYNVTGVQRISRTRPNRVIKKLKDYSIKDLEYAHESNDPSVQTEITPEVPVLAPNGSRRNGSNKVKYQGKPSRGKGAIDKAHYTCEFNSAHTSFISKKTGHNYMEPHHLIPISNQGLYEYDIDITPNLVCLCPVCHKQIHYGTKADVENMLRTLFTTTRKQDLHVRGIEIDIDTLLAYYDI